MKQYEVYHSVLEIKHKEALAAVSSLFEGDKLASHVWMMMPCTYFDGEKPINLLWTHFGCDKIIELAGKLEKGIIL